MDPTSHKKNAPKKKPGPARLELPEDYVAQLEAMARAGLNMDQTAALLGMGKDTLEARLKEKPDGLSAIEKGRAQAILKVGSTAFQLAVSGKVPAMTMFYLKCRAGWKESSNLSITDAQGNDLGQSFTELAKKLLK